MGKLNLILGPMYSGKTSTLLSRYLRYKVAGKNCLLIKYKEDNKPKNCKCSGVDLVFGNGTYWYCGNCKEVT